MPESKYILFFFGALGAFNGLVLSICFLHFAKRKHLSTFFLGCLLAALSIRIGKSVFVYFDPKLPRFYLQIGLSACLLIGPFLLFFIRSAIQQYERVPRSWMIQLTALVIVVVTAGILFPYSTYPGLWSNYFIKVIYAIWLGYLVASGVVLKDIFARMGRNGAEVRAPEKWLAAIFSANSLICASFILAYALPHLFHTYYAGAIIFTFVLYGMIFVYLYQGKRTDQFYLIPAKPVKKVMAFDAAVAVQSLERVMVNEALFKNANLTVSELAKAVNLSSHQLSQLLNDTLGKNFTSFINEYRINEACRMIRNGHAYTLEAIGYEVGFNSKSTFYAAFRKQTGTTPLLFKEELNKGGQISTSVA